MDNWIFPNPDDPDNKIGNVIHVDLDSREPLRDDQAEALNRALHQLILDRDKLNDHIQKMSQRLVLSAEKKVRMMRDGS